jgi:hypothetical protein
MDTNYFKYPRTPHLHWSPGTQSDDRLLKDASQFVGKEVVVTEKIDGENTSMYCDHCHARSMDSLMHPSRAWVRQLHGHIKHEIPPGFRVCGENMYAKHSIHYPNLDSYFYVFGVYDDKNTCLSWDETKEWCDLLGLHTVPELWRGMWDEDHVRNHVWTGQSVFGIPGEGYVVRVADAFPYGHHWDFAAKYVRKNHVQTSQFWMNQPVVPNLLKDKQ